MLPLTCMSLCEFIKLSVFQLSLCLSFLVRKMSIIIAYLTRWLWRLRELIHVGLPWWLSGWESAWQCRGHGFEPWSGKIPHVAEQLGPWDTTTEPARLEPVLHNKRGRDSERPAHCDEEWPPLAATRESPRTEMKTQHSQKIKINK